MKIKVKKTLFFNKDELQTILAALDKCDGQPFPQMSNKGELLGDEVSSKDFEQKCSNLASAIRKQNVFDRSKK